VLRAKNLLLIRNLLKVEILKMNFLTVKVTQCPTNKSLYLRKSSNTKSRISETALAYINLKKTLKNTEKQESVSKTEKVP
jgi:hypothetical protein